jgi:hypothetical protein
MNPAEVKMQVGAIAAAKTRERDRAEFAMLAAERGWSARQTRRNMSRALEGAGAKFVEHKGQRYAVLPKRRSTAVSARQRGISGDRWSLSTKRAARRRRKAARPWRND